MVTYANQEGIIREFSNIIVNRMGNGKADLIQHLISTKDNVQAFERRDANIDIRDNEDREELAIRLNSNNDMIINSRGILVALSI